MDKTLADTLTANLKSAKTPEARADAMTLSMIAIFPPGPPRSSIVPFESQR